MRHHNQDRARGERRSKVEVCPTLSASRDVISSHGAVRLVIGCAGELAGAMQGASLAALRLRHDDRQRRDLLTSAWLECVRVVRRWPFLAGSEGDLGGFRGISSSASVSRSSVTSWMQQEKQWKSVPGRRKSGRAAADAVGTGRGCHGVFTARGRCRMKAISHTDRRVAVSKCMQPGPDPGRRRTESSGRRVEASSRAASSACQRASWEDVGRLWCSSCSQGQTQGRR